MTVKPQVKKAVKLINKAVKSLKKDYTNLPLVDREVMFRDELHTLMAKYNCGLSVAIVDTTPITLPSIEA